MKYVANSTIFLGLCESITPGTELSESQIEELGGEEAVAKRRSIDVIDVEALQEDCVTVVDAEDAVASAIAPSADEGEQPKQVNNPKSAFMYDPEELEGMQLQELNALVSHAYQEDCEMKSIPISEEKIPSFRKKGDAQKYLTRDFK